MHFGEWCESDLHSSTRMQSGVLGLREATLIQAQLYGFLENDRYYLKRGSIGSQLALCAWTVAAWNNSDLVHIVVFIAMVVPEVGGSQGVSPHWVLSRIPCCGCASVCVRNNPALCYLCHYVQIISTVCTVELDQLLKISCWGRIGLSYLSKLDLQALVSQL